MLKSTSNTGSPRPRRLTVTIVCDQTDPIDSLLVKVYDGLPTKGHQRQDFLRRTLLLGVAQYLSATKTSPQLLLNKSPSARHRRGNRALTEIAPCD